MVDDEVLTWRSPLMWLALAWLVSYGSTWLGGGDDDAWVIPLAAVARPSSDTGGGTIPAANVGDESAPSQQQQQQQRPTLPHGHPPVPATARGLCAAAIQAAAQAAASQAGRTWLESKGVLITVSVAATLVAAVRRWHIERSAFLRARQRRPPPADPRDRPEMQMDEWLREHAHARAQIVDDDEGLYGGGDGDDDDDDGDDDGDDDDDKDDDVEQEHVHDE